MILELLDSLDPQQRAAVTDTAQRILVSAGAGSGKTRVLTARCLHLLDQQPKLSVDNILTLTFTRKAAQEMRERIACEINRQEDAARARNERAAETRWNNERQKLGRAPIGTIHGFCERVLREHALQAGIDPNFRLLDDALAVTLREKVLDEVMELAWLSADPEEGLDRLLLDVPQETLRGALLQVYGEARTHGRTIEAIRPAPGTDAAVAAAQVKSAIEELLASTGTPGWMAALAKASDCYQFDLLPLMNASWDGAAFWDRYYAAAEMQRNFTPNGGPKGVAKELRDAIRAAYAAWLQAQLDAAAEPYLRAMCALLMRFDAGYRQAKDADGLLDFEDLLLRVRALLEDDSTGVAWRFQTRFAHVMVDEFQDTNPLQFAIVSALCGTEGTLFTVGDVKQSIYRFIGSDVRVFLAYEDHLARGGDALLALRTNYRARPEVLQPINALFAARWPVHPERRDDGFSFQPLLSPPAPVRISVPALEIAFWGENEGGADIMRTREADWLARRVLQLTRRYDEPALLIDDPVDHLPRNADFGDIIVLFRVSTEIPRYAERMRAAGVPVYVVSGRGFFQAREVQDLIHLLRVVENPLDDFSLAVVLRSPLVGVGDDTLYWLSHAVLAQPEADNTEDTDPAPAPPRTYGRLWAAIERAEAIAQLSAVDRQALLAFRALLMRLQEMAAAGQPLELLDEILDRTGFATVLLAGEDGEQRYANVQKLRDVAAGFQKWGLFDLADFRRHLTNLQETAPREASAPLDAERSQSVRLMTIHAAKGLEAPVIFLADCGWGKSYQIRQHQRFLYQPDAGLACQAPTPEGDLADPAGYLAMRAQIDAEEAQEAERLLYVALTRARDHLICSGFVKKNILPPSYIELLTTMLDGAAETDDAGQRCIVYNGVRYPVREWTDDELRAVAALPAQAERTDTFWDVHRDRILRGEALPVPAGDVEPYQRIIERFALPHARGREMPLRVGVNRALCYQVCPRQYWLRYLLYPENAVRGAMPPVVEMEETPDDAETRADGTAFGLLLHEVMQRVNLAQPLSEQLPGILQVITAEDKLAIAEGDAAGLRACLERLAASEAYPWLTGATALHREQSFIAREGDVLYTGIIDVLGRGADAWWILDYKTGRFSTKHLRQVGLYALGVQAALGVDVQRVAVIYLDERDPAKAFQQRRVTPDLLDPLRAMLRGVGEGLRAADYHPEPGRQCEYCQYRNECPAGQAAVTSTI